MASREELYQALRNADAAGDFESAKKLSAYIQSMPMDVSPLAASIPHPQEKTGTLRAAADIPVQVGRGVAVGVKALSDVFGADNPVSRAASGVEDFLGGLLSAQAKNDQAEIARIMKEAQDKGVGDQVTAAVKAFATAPVDMLSQALGTAVPVIAGGLAGSVARLGAMGVGALGTGVGAAMGAGTVKGQIYDAVKQELKANNVPEAEAEKRAQEAQSYGGKNLDQILMGAGIGAAEAAFGAERILTGLLRKGAVAPSALPAKYRIPTVAATEAVPEMAQAAQEQVAQNIALQREGMDVPTMRGVVGQAALEGLAGAGLGAITGAVQRTEAAKPEAEAPKPAVPAEPEMAEAPEPLTTEEQRELELQQQMVLPPKPTAEEVLGEVRGKIQTAPPTAPADITRIRDEHETAVINSLLEQDRKMQVVSDLARANMERMSQLESMEAATQDTDRRVREGRLMGRVQSLIDENIPFASTAISDINRKFEMIGESPLDDTERSRVQNIMTMAQGFTDFVKLPSLPVREQDRFAENQAMEALIKERKPRGEVSTQPVRAETPAPSPVVGEAPVSGRIEEGRAIRPEVSPEPRIAEDRQRAEPELEAAPEPVVAEETPPASGVPESKTPTGGQAGWVLRNKETGEVVMETNDPAKVKALNTEKYEAVPIVQYLASLSKPQKPAAPKAEAPAVEAPAAEAPVAPEIAPLQDAYNKAKAALDAIGTEPAKPSPEARYFGIKGREGAAPELVRAYDDKVKAYNSWKRKYSKLKKEEVEASNVLFRAKQAQERKSLGGAQAQQSNFEQTLRALLNKFGLKDVGLSIIEGMQDAGSYAQQLIQIASDSANPIRTLRHEAIHALRELGFFTPQQWQSLSKMAKDKWIDQYLKQRNVDGKPLKSGEESRYDAYMREYNGDTEKITEEAVADAFSDFDATKPPSGLVSALLTRLRNLFQSIKSALTKVESPEQIFGKVERGELKAGEAKPEAEARMSLRKPGEPTPTDAGQQALDTLKQLGMEVKGPEPSKLEKTKKFLQDTQEAPVKETAKKLRERFSDFMTKIDGQVFSADAPFENAIRKGRKQDFTNMEEFIGAMLNVSQSQAVGPDAVSTQSMLIGKPKYDKETQKWVAVEDSANEIAKAAILDSISEKYGLTKEEASQVAHTYLSAANYESILKRNAANEAKIEELRKEGKDEEADDLKAALVFVTEDQAAMVGPGKDIANKIPEVKKITELWNKQRENIKDVMVETGLWSTEYADAMMDNAAYVPFYREMEGKDDATPAMMMRGLQVKAKEQKLKGSKRAVADVFENMARWQQYAVNRAIRNHKAVQMIKEAEKIKVGDTTLARPLTKVERGQNVVRVWIDGKQKMFEMADPLFMDAFTSLGSVSIPTIKYFTEISNLLRRSVVMYPLFSLGQVPQDAVAAIFTSGLTPKHAFKIPYLAVREFVKTMRGTSNVHNELKNFGAVGVRDFNAAVSRQDAEITAGIKAPRGVKEKTMYVLDRIAMSADNAVRQAVYEASLAEGLPKKIALEKAFEIINFRRRGSSKMLNLIGQTVPFFYAYLSAQRVAYKTLTGIGISPGERKAALETLAYTSAAVMALSFIYAIANGDDEEYEKTPTNIRDRSIVIPGSGGLRIPLRTDFFLFPKIIAEHTYHLMADNGFSDPAKFKKAMADNLANAALSPNVVPQVLKPTLEVGINYSFFEGKPIVGFFEQNKEASRQFSESTSEFAKLMGGAGVSPQKVDHLVRGYFGSVGGLFLWGTNFFIEGESGVPRPELSWRDAVTTMPGVGAFKQKPSENALKVDFYELRDAIEKAKNTYDDIKKRSPEGLQDFIENEENYAKLALEKSVTKIADHLSVIRRTIQQISAAPEERFSAAEKQERIKELRELELQLLKSVNLKEMREMAKM